MNEALLGWGIGLICGSWLYRLMSRPNIRIKITGDGEVIEVEARTVEQIDRILNSKSLEEARRVVRMASKARVQ